ncbi:hypothetical protein MKK75_20945 [Methylobacterium sp. J-030]|uniref:hypothetical protein n=1 Tax=Methylobacterium sp. J-030 TaxID=2836627 RepID=UPI001FBA6B19|nr:hypothetical protein [Methylobacterium sp. J-030]MCJ2071230.1 hypothetical protein [Methylobacterium sp. J-030]
MPEIKFVNTIISNFSWDLRDKRSETIILCNALGVGSHAVCIRIGSISAPSTTLALASWHARLVWIEVFKSYSEPIELYDYTRGCKIIPNFVQLQ